MPFFKLSGAGNDFVALVEPVQTPDPETVRAWCRRGLSIGADGVMILRRRDAAVHLEHWNADGTLADLCLNGSRCAVRLACHLGWHDDQQLVRLETGAGPVNGRQISEDVSELSLPWPLGTGETLELVLPEGRFQGHRLTVGVPHFVIFIKGDPAHFDLDTLGPKLRHHEDLLPDGANINVVRCVSSAALELRTFERGVEGETLACGTGAIASVRLGAELGLLGPETRATTAGGFTLEVRLADEAVTLAGDARIVARGELWSAV